MAAKPAAANQGSALDRLSTAGRALVGVIFVAIVGVLYFVFFYADLDSQIAGSKQRFTQLQGELSRAQESKEAYQKDLDEKTRRETLSQQQKKILPDDPEMPAFLQALQNTATISGVELTAWTPVDEVPMEFYARVPMKLVLKGKFHQVAKFVYSVGQLDRIINIENINLKNPTATEGDEVVVEVECLATAFRAVRADEASAVANRRRQGQAQGGGH